MAYNSRNQQQRPQRPQRGVDVLFTNAKIEFDPEYRWTPKGQRMAKFQVNQSFNRNKRNRDQAADWQQVRTYVVLFGEMAEKFENEGFVKGDILSFVGRQEYSARREEADVGPDWVTNVYVNITINEDNPLIPVIGWAWVKQGSMDIPSAPVARATLPPPPPPRPARPAGPPPVARSVPEDDVRHDLNVFSDGSPIPADPF